MGIIRRKKRQIRSEYAWLLGICEHGYEDLMAGRIHWISDPSSRGKRWYADPFILDYDQDTVTLLVEDFDYKLRRGRIAKLIVSRKNWKVVHRKIILDLDTHLSFPMIWREDGHIYVCPENFHSGTWRLYEYDAQEECLKNGRTLVDEKLTDTILYKSSSTYYVLSTYEPIPNAPFLTIYQSDSLMGPFQKMGEVAFEERIARNAGMVFVHEGKLIRPAMECNQTYGHAIVFQEMTLQDGQFSFKEIGRFTSPHPNYADGAHTYNQYKGMAVLDVKGKRYPFLSKVLTHLSVWNVKVRQRE